MVNNGGSFVDLDPNRLDEALLGQPRLFLQYAEKAADARSAWSEAKANLEVVRAELELEVREDPTAFNLPKSTEATITACVAIQPRHKAAVKKLIFAKHELDVLEAAVGALEHRKKMIELAVQLDSRSYFAKPSVHAPDRQRMEENTAKHSRRRAARTLKKEEEGDDYADG